MWWIGSGGLSKALRADDGKKGVVGGRLRLAFEHEGVGLEDRLDVSAGGSDQTMIVRSTVDGLWLYA